MKRTSLVLLILFSTSGCFNSVSSADHEDGDVFQITSNGVKIDASSKLLPHLEIVSLKGAESRRVNYQSVGKMIALSNASNDLTGPKTSWVELDAETLRAAHLLLKPEAEGVGYGLTTIPAEFSRQIQTGQQLRIRRYEVAEEGWTGTATEIFRNAQDPTLVDVVFRLSEARDLYPGTNCEVTFPLLRAQAVKVPSTALIHEGLDEYVWQLVAPNEFTPRKVSLAEGTSDEVILSSGISASASIIGRGAILLKPELKPFLTLKETSHALSNDSVRAQ